MSLRSKQVQPCESKKKGGSLNKDGTSDHNLISNMKSGMSPQNICSKPAGLFPGLVSIIRTLNMQKELVV